MACIRGIHSVICCFIVKLVTRYTGDRMEAGRKNQHFFFNYKQNDSILNEKYYDYFLLKLG